MLFSIHFNDECSFRVFNYKMTDLLMSGSLMSTEMCPGSERVVVTKMCVCTV